MGRMRTLGWRLLHGANPQTLFIEPTFLLFSWPLPYPRSRESAHQLASAACKNRRFNGAFWRYKGGRSRSG